MSCKIRRSVFNEEVDKTVKDICLEISKRFEISFLEIGIDKNHVHFLIQSVPKYSATKIIRTIKSIIAKKVFEKHPEVKEILWGGEFWSDGYFVNTVSKFGNEATISKYVQSQGVEKEYKKLHSQQLSLF